jgi:hypothetical protein
LVPLSTACNTNYLNLNLNVNQRSLFALCMLNNQLRYFYAARNGVWEFIDAILLVLPRRPPLSSDFSPESSETGESGLGSSPLGCGRLNAKGVIPYCITLGSTVFLRVNFGREPSSGKTRCIVKNSTTSTRPRALYLAVRSVCELVSTRAHQRG